MLVGYLLLLREAAKADAERREMARYRMASAASAASAASVATAAPAAHVASAAKIVAFLPPPEEQIYDQYTDAKLRAVGD
jgi:phosphate-selective porin